MINSSSLRHGGAIVRPRHCCMSNRLEVSLSADSQAVAWPLASCSAAAGKCANDSAILSPVAQYNARLATAGWAFFIAITSRREAAQSAVAQAWRVRQASWGNGAVSALMKRYCFARLQAWAKWRAALHQPHHRWRHAGVKI